MLGNRPPGATHGTDSQGLRDRGPCVWFNEHWDGAAERKISADVHLQRVQIQSVSFVLQRPVWQAREARKAPRRRSRQGGENGAFWSPESLRPSAVPLPSSPWIDLNDLPPGTPAGPYLHTKDLIVSAREPFLAKPKLTLGATCSTTFLLRQIASPAHPPSS